MVGVRKVSQQCLLRYAQGDRSQCPARWSRCPRWRPRINAISNRDLGNPEAGAGQHQPNRIQGCYSVAQGLRLTSLNTSTRALDALRLLGMASPIPPGRRRRLPGGVNAITTVSSVSQICGRGSGNVGPTCDLHRREGARRWRQLIAAQRDRDQWGVVVGWNFSVGAPSRIGGKWGLSGLHTDAVSSGGKCPRKQAITNPATGMWRWMTTIFGVELAALLSRPAP